MESVCVMLGHHPPEVSDRKSTPEDIERGYWTEAKRMLSDFRFLQTLISFDKDTLSEELIDKIDRYTALPEFTASRMEKVSKAATCICKWVVAIDNYFDIMKVIEPKRSKLREAEGVLDATREKLEGTRESLRKILEGIEQLREKYSMMLERKAVLQAEAAAAADKLKRAENLLHALSGERTRWEQLAEEFAVKFSQVVGDVLLSGGYIAYLGPLTAPYRAECRQTWMTILSNNHVAYTPAFSLSDALCKDLEMGTWHLAGLPHSAFALENAVIMSNSRLWPLILDPMTTANNWLKNLLKTMNLVVIQSPEREFERLKTALAQGHSVLLESFPEEVDPLVDDLMRQRTSKRDDQLVIQLGEAAFPFSEEFQLYITTRLSAPRLPSELLSNVVLVNFNLSHDEVLEQLLAFTVLSERPDLEAESSDLSLQRVKNDVKLRDVEEKVLSSIAAKTAGTVLDDESIVETLGESRDLSIHLNNSNQAIEENQRKIEEVRGIYESGVAVKAASLFFCLQDLVLLSPMYRFSLKWYIGVYKDALGTLAPAGAAAAAATEERLTLLCDAFVRILYTTVCRSLYDQHKLSFALQLSTCLGLLEGRLTREELTFLLKQDEGASSLSDGPAAASFSSSSAAAAETAETAAAALGGDDAIMAALREGVEMPSWLSERQWNALRALTRLLPEVFTGLPESVAFDHAHEWERLAEASAESTGIVLPIQWEQRLSEFQRLLVLRCLSRDALLPALQSYAGNALGVDVVSPPGLDLEMAYSTSTSISPLVFMLSPGSDPMQKLQRFAEQQNRKLFTVSLGKGQGPAAEKLIRKYLTQGRWIVLQNCHLAASWMQTLQQLCEALPNEGTHSEFRLWLTTAPVADFPASILQMAVKMVHQPPAGMRAKLEASLSKRALSGGLGAGTSSFTSAEETGTGAADAEIARWLTALQIGLCVFHAVVQERRHFGSLGLNVPYLFTDGDLEISLAHAREIFTSGAGAGKHATLRYMVGQAYYGGRISDEWDRRLIDALLAVFVPSGDDVDPMYAFRFLEDGQLMSTRSGEAVVDYLDSLPEGFRDKPGVFRLHSSALRKRAQLRCTEVLEQALALQPQPHSGDLAHTYYAESILDIVDDLLKRLPEKVTGGETVKKASTTSLDAEDDESDSPRLAQDATTPTTTLDAQSPLSQTDELYANLLRAEITRYMSLLKFVRATLEHVSGVLRGREPMTERADATAKALHRGAAPLEWLNAGYLTAAASVSEWTDGSSHASRSWSAGPRKGRPRSSRSRASSTPPRCSGW